MLITLINPENYANTVATFAARALCNLALFAETALHLTELDVNNHLIEICMSTAAEDESLCSHVAHAFYNMVTHDEVRKRIVTDRSFDAIMQLRSRAASFTVQAHAAGALACLSIDNRCKDRVFSLCTRTDSQRLIAQGQELLFAGLIVRGLSRIDSNRSMLVKRGVLQILYTCGTALTPPCR